MDDVSVLCFDDLLDQDSHEHLVEVNSDLLHSEEGSFIELACPHFLDRNPGFREICDSKLIKPTLQLIDGGVVRVSSLECEVKDDLLASEESAGHLLYFLGLAEPEDESIDAGMALWIASSEQVLHQFEGQADRFWNMKPVGNLVFEVLQVVRLRAHLLGVEVSEGHDALSEVGRVFERCSVLDSCL